MGLVGGTLDFRVRFACMPDRAVVCVNDDWPKNPLSHDRSIASSDSLAPNARSFEPLRNASGSRHVTIEYSVRTAEGVD